MAARVYVFNVANADLPRATQAMNCDHGHFSSAVREVMPGRGASRVVVAISGYYPFVTGKWDFIDGELPKNLV